MDYKFIKRVKDLPEAIEFIHDKNKLEEAIRERAYCKWVDRGRPMDNTPMIDWDAAEHEIKLEQKKKKKKVKFPNLERTSEPLDEYEDDDEF